jgi:hypothetical protein
VLCRAGHPRGGKDWYACEIGLHDAQAEKLNSYELLAPLELVVPGLGRPICLQNRVKRGKKQVWHETEIAESCSICFTKNKIFFCHFQSEIGEFTSCKKRSLFADLEAKSKLQKIKIQGHC